MPLLFGPLGKDMYLVDAIEKVQDRSAHYLYNDYHSDSSTSSMVKNQHWDSLEARQTKSSLVMFYKCLIS